MATVVSRRSACARQEVPVLLRRQHPRRHPLLLHLQNVSRHPKLTAREQDAKDQATAKRLVGAAVLTAKRRDTSGKYRRHPLLLHLQNVSRHPKLTAREQDAKDQATAKRLVGAAVLTAERRDTSGKYNIIRHYIRQQQQKNKVT